MYTYHGLNLSNATVSCIICLGLEKAVKVGKMLLDRIEIVQVDAENFNSSWNIFKKQHDSHLSFTDCTNVATMKAFGITRSATFDQDFKSISDISIIA